MPFPGRPAGFLGTFVLPLFLASPCGAYWLMAANNILTTQRLDPIISPGSVSTHAHSVLGGSNFGLNTSTAALRKSSCTSIPIPEDKSNYWFPVGVKHFPWSNGTFTRQAHSRLVLFRSNCYLDYLFNDTPGYTTEFPDDFRMVSGDPTLRTLDPSSFAQQAITFLCLDFNGKSNRYNELPRSISCPSGIRSQINFPSCWNGKDTDSTDHKSHVAFLSTGPDNGTCTDPGSSPRFICQLVYWISQVFEDQRKDAMTPSQPFVQVESDPTGYGYHADFFNGWDSGVLQKALNGCNCNPYGDATCCVNQGIFGMNTSSVCYITNSVDEQSELSSALGTLSTLPGNNPIQAPCYQTYIDPITPPILSPVYVYNGSAGGPTGTVATPAQTAIVTQTANGSCIRKGSSMSSRRPPSLFLLGVLATSVVNIVFEGVVGR
ncbi:hypothetical protein B0H16DRAFT_1314999 [Mycena metata]|uniref:DUF1996 domain-containing protein n=1 Tax=Mycena metata TaxID=1033252 RepID=A0AAD7NDY2_9AGAR|nr:hypothetical protein B0H16DRAFT_1314999 [Mycena metata]